MATKITILTGLNRDLRRAKLMDGIKTMTMRKNADAMKMYLIVPEETTFISQRELLLRLGNSASRYIECVGPERLKERVYALVGHRPECMDDGGRLLSMAAAVRAVRTDLKCYKASAQKPEFLEMMLRTYDMLEQYDVEPESVIDSDKVSDSLKRKMEDIKAIVDAYNSVTEDAKLDPNQESKLFPQVIMEYAGNKFAKTFFFVEGFSELNKQQRAIIIALAQVSAGMVVSLPCDGKDDERASSATTVATLGLLLKDCENANLNVAFQSAPNTQTEHEALCMLQSELCSDTLARPYNIPNAEKRIRLFTDATPFGEIQHIAGTIMQAVRNGNYRYTDISVVLTDYERYAPIVEQIFARYGIPAYFGSRKTEIERRPVMAAINSALDAATHGMQKVDVIQFLKSGIASLTMDEADKLENYALTWNIRGRGWSPDGGWVMHPDGYGREFTEDAEKRLEELNDIRERSVAPLLRLRDKLYSAEKVSDAVVAVNEFLNETGFHDQLQSIVEELIERGDRQTAMEYAQVNEVFCTALEQMNGAIGHMETNPSDFAKMLRMLCGVYRIATIPSTIDQVQVFDMLDSRHICSKIRYIAGCTEGAFPSYSEGASSILTPDDAEEIHKATEKVLPCATNESINRQMSDINAVISGAKRMLIFSYPYGIDTVPSSLYQRVSQLLPSVKPEKGCGEDGIYKAELLSKTACAKLLGRISNKGEYTNIQFQLADVLGEDEEASDIAERLLDKAEWNIGHLSQDSVEGLYGETIPLTASKTDTYAACRYHHFLRYGLNLREPATGKLNSPVFGSFAHAVLEGAVKEIEATGGFSAHTCDEIHEITHKYVDKYTSEKLRSLEGQPIRYTYLHMRNTREVLAIMDTMTREFAKSHFHAENYEFRVGGKDADMPAIPIVGENAQGEFTGIVDRIDGAEVNGTPYFRIIDYKTGKTMNIDYTDLLAGKATQLLLYQSAISKLKGDTQMGGVLYVPARDSIAAFQIKPTDDEAIAKEHQKMNQRHGLVVDKPEVLAAMEEPSNGKFEFLPVKVSKDGIVSGELCTEEQLNMLNKYIDLQMGDIVDGIHSGNVEANPISRGPERNACTYCENRAACHKDCMGTKYSYRSRTSAEEFWAKVEARLERG